MKKTIFLLLMAICTLTLSSCYKAWTCVCEITTYDPPNAPEVERFTIPTTGFKSSAAKSCDKGDSDASSTMVTTCELQ